MKFTTLLIMLLLTAAAGAAIDSQYLQGLGDARYHEVRSDEVGRSFHVFVMLPDGYEPSGGVDYPTIYVLDGGALFPLLGAYYRYLRFGEEVPESIIVGISYGSESFDNGNYRSTDYTAPAQEREYWGGAEEFQDSLSDELIPFIEHYYRSNAERRIIFGQSIGGQFVLYTSMTQPTLFWGHIASNPALHRNLPFFLQQHAQPGHLSKLFVASATMDDPTYRIPAQAWIKHWNNSAEKPWQLKTVDLEGHNHFSSPPAAFRQGMKWLFRDGARAPSP